MRTKEKGPIVLYNSDEAARKVTVTGWASKDGRFWGNDEHMARWDGCTHKLCECGEICDKSYTKCDKCIAKQRHEIFLKTPFKEWDGKTPVVLFDNDTYFFSEDDIEYYCDDNELKPEDLRLLICEPLCLSQIDYDYWNDDLPEDGELPPKVEEALKALNKAIEEEGTVSWWPGKFRTEYKPSTL